MAGLWVKIKIVMINLSVSVWSFIVVPQNFFSCSQGVSKLFWVGAEWGKGASHENSRLINIVISWLLLMKALCSSLGSADNSAALIAIDGSSVTNVSVFYLKFIFSFALTISAIFPALGLNCVFPFEVASGETLALSLGRPRSHSHKMLLPWCTWGQISPFRVSLHLA